MDGQMFLWYVHMKNGSSKWHLQSFIEKTLIGVIVFELIVFCSFEMVSISTALLLNESSARPLISFTM